MPLNDDAVVTGATGYVFDGPVGTAPPSPAELDTTDPAVFGAQVITLKLTGGATGGTLTLSVNGSTDDTVALVPSATAGQVQAALEALPQVGTSNVLVTGTALNHTDGLKVAVVGRKQGKVITIEGDVTALVGGTANALEATETTTPNGWNNIGHTSRDDMPEWGFDGGDTEIRGTWQNPNLREVVTKQAADYLKLFVQQMDKHSFELYYGENAATTPGVFGVAGGTPKPNEKAFLVIIVDGDVRIGFYVRKASVRRDDSMDVPVDAFATLPIRATFLKDGPNRLFDWISEDLFGDDE